MPFALCLVPRAGYSGVGKGGPDDSESAFTNLREKINPVQSPTRTSSPTRLLRA